MIDLLVNIAWVVCNVFAGDGTPPTSALDLAHKDELCGHEAS